MGDTTGVIIIYAIFMGTFALTFMLSSIFFNFWESFVFSLLSELTFIFSLAVVN